MPTYQYACAECGADHEAVQKMSDPSLTVCPACGAEALRKKFTNVGVVFKGSGFYRTDSRGSKSSESTSKSDSSGSSSSASAPSGGASSSGASTGGASTPASTSSSSSKATGAS